MVSVHGLLCTERRSGRNRRSGWACSSCCILWPSSEVRDIQRPQRYSFLGQHRAIASAVFDGSFVPILPFEKLEIHPVFLRFSNVVLCQTISPNSLAELCGDALIQYFLWCEIYIISRNQAEIDSVRLALDGQADAVGVQMSIITPLYAVFMKKL